MTGFCGWAGIDGRADELDEQLQRMGERLGPATIAQPVRVSGSRGGLLVAGLHDDDRIAHDGSRVAIVQGPAWFTDGQLDQLAREQGVAAALLAGHDERGADVLATLAGGFAVALLDTERGTALLAIDRVGGRYPLCYHSTGEGLVFGSRTAAVRAHSRAAGEIDAQGLYNYLYFHVVPGPGTVWTGLQRLLPGSYVRHADGASRLGRYWRITYREHERAGLADLETEFRARLDAGVRRAVEGVAAGCFLSGGTDSSTVAGLLGTATGRPAQSYSIGFDAPGYDEMGFARLAARHFGAKLREYYVTADDVVELLPRIAESYGQPFGNESVIPAYFCAKVAREEGVERMLAGDGGDELFAGNARYAKQELFERYGRIPGWMRRALFEPLFLGLPGGDRVPPLRKVRNYIRQANVPMPRRAESYNYLERMGPPNVFTSEFLSCVDTEAPLHLLAEAYDDAQAGTMLNRFLALDLRFTLADNDLPKVSRMCDLAGVEVAYPILDDELIDFAARLPPGLKMKGRRLRWFWKHALRDFLPREVLDKPKHGFGLPYGVWLLEHEGLQRITGDSLRGLRRRGIVQTRFIDEVERLHREEHAVYYGAMIWTLVQLEQWFRFHVDRQ